MSELSTSHIDRIVELERRVKELTWERDVAREETRLWIGHWLETLQHVKAAGSPEFYKRAVQIVDERSHVSKAP